MIADQHPLGPFVRRFLLEEMVADRNLSRHTQRSYRDTLRLLFDFLATRHAIAPSRVTVEQLTPTLIRGFLTHLEEERGNAVATRNQRLAALHSLLRFISRHVPELVEQASQIQSIAARRTVTPSMPYLEKQEIDALLAVPNRQRPQGRRDYAVLLFLYNTGARASEAAAVTIADLTFTPSASVRLLGKGRKIRLCPLWSQTADRLRQLLSTRLDGPQEAPVFLNVRGQPLTRYGIHTLVARTVRQARCTTSSLQRKRVSPHTLRHTTAVHLLRAGVDINTIRAWLGHVSLQTTNRYAEIDLEMKTAALETCALPENHPEHHPAAPLWRQDSDLMAFLAGL
jgi:site-specific recombinase XerD